MAHFTLLMSYLIEVILSFLKCGNCGKTFRMRFMEIASEPESSIAQRAMVKAPLAPEAVEANPTDGEKNGTKRSILVDGKACLLNRFWLKG
jgi:hypothetical protein